MVIHQAATAPGVVFKCELLGALRIKQKDPDGPEVRNDRYIFCPRKEDAPDEPEFKGWQGADKAAESLKTGMSAFQRKFGR